MSCNNLCFCGSGKKQKKCHADTNEKSVIANLLFVFNQIDIENKYCFDSICHNGCGDCCVDDFKVSSVEFFAILHYLLENDKMSILETAINRSVDKQNNTKTDNKCIFFDSKNNNCSIYHLRPIACRRYGYDIRITDCPKIINSSHKLNLLNSSKVDSLTNITVFNSFATANHELSYWFSLYQNKSFKTKRMKDLFECSKYFTINEYCRIMTLNNDSARNFDINEF